MDPTTLTTFIVRAPPEVRIVELLGSWDNFQQPYRMHHDRRRGNGFWSGCFKFENIVFDGDVLEWSKPRSGGLKQGGTYWYYYQLNYDYDFFDDRQPRTTACPLLPGQTVNVIEVPRELVRLPQRSQSAHADLIGSLMAGDRQQTMDPGDKFAMLQPPPKSRVHLRCLSDEALDGRLEKEQHPLIVAEDPISPLSSAHSPYLPPRDCVDSRMDFYPVKEHHDSRPTSRHSNRSIPVGYAGESYDGEDNHAQQDVFGSNAPHYHPYSGAFGHNHSASIEALGAFLYASTREAEASESLPGDDLPQRFPKTYEPVRTLSATSLAYPSNGDFQCHDDSHRDTSLADDTDQYNPGMYTLSNVETKTRLHGHLPLSPVSPIATRSPLVSGDVAQSLAGNVQAGDLNDLVPLALPAAMTGSHLQDHPSALSPPNSSDGDIPIPVDSGEFGANTDREEDLAADLSYGTSPVTHEAQTWNISAERRAPRSAINFSLPTRAIAKELLSIQMTSPSIIESSQHLDPLSAPVLADGTGTSMAEDIFSQLGF